MAAPHHFSWAEETEEAEKEDPSFGARFEPKFEPRDGWHEGLEVKRDQAPQRLNLQHGFVRDIVSVRAGVGRLINRQLRWGGGRQGGALAAQGQLARAGSWAGRGAAQDVRRPRSSLTQRLRLPPAPRQAAC